MKRQAGRQRGAATASASGRGDDVSSLSGDDMPSRRLRGGDAREPTPLPRTLLPAPTDTQAVDTVSQKKKTGEGRRGRRRWQTNGKQGRRRAENKGKEAEPGGGLEAEPPSVRPTPLLE